MTDLADEVWWMLSGLVTESLGDYRRAVVDAVGMPFSRVRLLRRLAGGPLTLKALAYAATMDAPAATVSINDLEKRGLVTRQVSATSGREKLVSLTPAGRAVLDRVLAVRQPAPASVTRLSKHELEKLKQILD